MYHPLFQRALCAFPPLPCFRSLPLPCRSVSDFQICELEDGHKAFAFSTGMAALSAVTRLVRTGQEIILNNDSYGGTYRLLSKVGPRCVLFAEHAMKCMGV